MFILFPLEMMEGHSFGEMVLNPGCIELPGRFKKKFFLIKKINVWDISPRV